MRISEIIEADNRLDPNYPRYSMMGQYYNKIKNRNKKAWHPPVKPKQDPKSAAEFQKNLQNNYAEKNPMRYGPGNVLNPLKYIKNKFQKDPKKERVI